MQGIGRAQPRSSSLYQESPRVPAQARPQLVHGNQVPKLESPGGQPGPQQNANQQPRQASGGPVHERQPGPQHNANQQPRQASGGPAQERQPGPQQKANQQPRQASQQRPREREGHGDDEEKGHAHPAAGAADSTAASLETNNMIYQVIQDHKQREMERQIEVLRDAQSITETMLRKRREADESRSVVVAASQSYTNNARYVDINSGGDTRIRLGRGMHPLSPDECDVYTSLVDASPGSGITAAMNHHISEEGQVDGFRFSCPGSDVASVLPLSRRMFFLTSMVECHPPRGDSGSDDDDDDDDEDCGVSSVGDADASSAAGSRASRSQRRIEAAASELESIVESCGQAALQHQRPGRPARAIGYATATIVAGARQRRAAASAASVASAPPSASASVPRSVASRGGENAVALELLVRQREVRDRLVRLVQAIHRDSVGMEAGFHCIPDNSDIVGVGGGQGRVDAVELFGTVHNRKVADARQWAPEMPERVGIYHAYVRGFNKDSRSHRLFIVTSGGCTSMCDSYFNMFVDVRGHMKVADVANSEETWFVRNACRRNNARILLAVAREFGLGVPTITDTYDCDRGQIASCDSETVHYDIARDQASAVGMYSVSSMAIDPATCKNGVLFSMHPGEGVWIFKGPVQTSSAMCTYGGAFGIGKNSSPGSTGFGGGAAFPTSTSRAHGGYSWRSKAVAGSKVCTGSPCIVNTAHTPGVAVVGPKGEVLARGSNSGRLPAQEPYTYVDESYITSLGEDCGWSRDNGVVELIPIAVVEKRSFSLA